MTWSRALRLQGIEATPTTPDELRTRVEADIAKWKKLAEGHRDHDGIAPQGGP